jgi:hypothetical protein
VVADDSWMPTLHATGWRFAVGSGDRSLLLAAPSEAEMHGWLTALMQALRVQVLVRAQALVCARSRPPRRAGLAALVGRVVLLFLRVLLFLCACVGLLVLW